MRISGGIGGLMRACAALACVATLPLTAASASPSGSAAQVRAVYRTVLTAEYFGPAGAVCSHLTAAGVRSFTAGGPSTCAGAFAAAQHVLRHRTRGVDDSGYSPAQWRSEVARVMADLRVRVRGSRASATGGQSGIPGRTTLVRTASGWKFSSYPPSVQP